MFRCMPFLACNRQVDSLDKRQCNLQAVPTEVERYARSLEELLLDMNHIKELSKSLFRLHKLRRLNLSDNDIYRLPPDISSLQSLVELNLSRNDISDIPENLKFCKMLMFLDLSSNPITRLPATITQLRSLTTLGLNDVSLTQLPQDIGQLVNLKSLEVRENLIRTLPTSIAFLAQLQRLDLGQNELDELPPEMGRLTSLTELYVDANDLEALPREITDCKALQQLDVSENKLMVLPDELGELELMTDLTLSQNCIQTLPHSIGRMKKLGILKLDKNTLVTLTPAIGSCVLLQELFLTENLLTELPSSIGNLKQLKNLNLDKNQLVELPTTIGGCTSLGVLSVRDNQIEQLPMELGKLEKLRVLDSQALLKLQTEQDQRTGIKVLTCYLLPQQSASGAQDPERQPNRSIVGGPKVHFGDENVSQEEPELPLGNFERHDTPHPKPHTHAPKLKKQTIDGHVIHHDDDPHAHPTTISLGGRKKSQDDRSASPEKPVAPPRSALKHPPPAQTQIDADDQQRGVAFSNDVAENDERLESKLKRQNTPHYTKGARVHEIDQETAQQKVDRIMQNTQGDSLMALQIEQHTLPVRRDKSGGLGLSIAGGLGSTPYKGDDPGLFISKLVDDGPADRAGLKIGDKLLKVNHTDVTNVEHSIAVQCMQGARDIVEMTIAREVLKPTTSYSQSPNQSLDTSFMSEADSANKETVSTSIKRDPNGSPGFAVSGGKGSTPFRSGDESIYISSISREGPADRDGKLRVGDRVLSINGVNMRGARHDQAVALLTGHSDIEIYLVVQRDKNFNPSPMGLLATPTKPLVVGPLATSSPNPTPTSTLQFGKSTSGGLSSPFAAGPADSWDDTCEDVSIKKEKESASLGLSIVGGSDHSSHPFGINRPGVFVSKIAVGSPSARCGRLRIGDRILSVNGVDLTQAKHQDAVQALKSSGKDVLLKVVHERQPAGLREVKIEKRSKEPLGINICGGIHSPPANPLDRTDEGVFVERVQLEGAAARNGQLKAGLRLLEVNDESLLGCTQDEAADALRNAGSTVRLLVCDGFDAVLFPPSPHDGPSLDSSKEDDVFADADDSAVHCDAGPSDRPIVASTPKPDVKKPSMEPNGHYLVDQRRNDVSSGYRPHEVKLPVHATADSSSTPSSSTSPSATSDSSGPAVADRSPATAHRPTTNPTTTPTANLTNYNSSKSALLPPSKPSVPPPVAPKPAVGPKPLQQRNGGGIAPIADADDDGLDDPVALSKRPTALADKSNSPSSPAAVPERQSFNSKLKQFEHEVEVRKAPVSSSKLPKPQLPAKKPLLNEEEVRKIKEEESRKLASLPSPFDDQLSPSAMEAENNFAHLLTNSPVPRGGPAVVRTKKAENRLAAASPPTLPSPTEPLNSVEQRAAEAQKRAEWRQARLKSLEADAMKAEKVMQQVRQMNSDSTSNSRLANISEEGAHNNVNERVLQNETSVERFESVDPVTGAKTISVVERSVTQREIEMSSNRPMVALNPSEIGFMDDDASSKEGSSRR
uniref:PDZ domain-containing protein n=1 Tax=Plectus sambesii TaxID=2011161 RepID=A0A914XB08_9BILA